MIAIIRALSSGEHYLALIGEDGTVDAMSDRLPVAGAKDPETGEPTDWGRFEDAHVEYWDELDDPYNDPAKYWNETTYVVVHRYDG